MQRRVLSILMSLLVCLVSAGPASARISARAADDFSVAFEPTACPYELPAGLVDGESVRCGFLTVPQRHAEPNGPTLRLGVAVIASTAKKPASDPLVILAGGPGQGTDSLLLLFGEGYPFSLNPLRERSDVILLDQRGTGAAEPKLSCPTDVPVAPGTMPILLADEDAGRLLIDCADDLREAGVDLEAFTSKESAADVDTLRAALALEQINLLGVSYGSRLALEVMRDFPEAVRSAVLASPLPLEADLIGGQIVAFDAALKRIFKGCAADPVCDEAYPALAETFSATYAELNDSPISVSVEDPATGESVELTVDGALFGTLVYITTFVGPIIPLVPPLISTAAAGDESVMASLLPVLLTFGAGVSTGLLYAVNCQDELPFSSPAQVAETIADADVLPELATGGFAGEIAFSFDVCAAWNLDPSPAEANEPVRSEVPTLIVSGEFDPITPPSYGEQIASALANATSIVVPGAGHDPVGTGGACPLTIVNAFLTDPTETVDQSCLEELGADFSPEAGAAP